MLQAARTIVFEGQSETSTQQLPDKLPIALRDERHHIRYVIDVSRCADRPARALWVFRVGAPYSVTDDRGRPLALMTTGTPLQIAGAARFAREGQYNGRIPAIFALPVGARAVTLELLTLPYIPSGLIGLHEGPVQDLLPLQEITHREVVAHADTVSGVVLVFGVLAVMLWRQRREDQSLLWLAVGCAMWGVRGVVYFNPQIYVSPLAFELLNTVNALIALAALAASVLARSEAFTPRAKKALAFAASAGTLAIVAAAYAGRGAAGARFLGFVFVIWILVWILVHAVRGWRSPTSRALAILLAVLFATTIHDLGVVVGVRPPDSPSIVFWGFAIMLVGVCILSGQYVVTMLNRAERANDELILRIAEKSDELERSYEQLREIERDHARTAERERMVRDLHDGLSAQLVTTLRGVERGALNQQAVAGSLQDSLDELRLLMDSGEIGDYLPGALAAWRNRWERRLEAAGIALEWHIDDSVDGVILPGDTTMHVMRILQEAATNVVKHSRATRVRMSARVDSNEGRESLRLDVVDDGAGMAAQSSSDHRGRGVRNMAHRAKQIGAELQMGPGEGGRGTRVSLTLPVTRRAAAA